MTNSGGDRRALLFADDALLLLSPDTADRPEMVRVGGAIALTSTSSSLSLASMTCCCCCGSCGTNVGAELTGFVVVVVAVASEAASPVAPSLT